MCNILRGKNPTFLRGDCNTSKEMSNFPERRYPTFLRGDSNVSEGNIQGFRWRYPTFRKRSVKDSWGKYPMFSKGRI
jgi:hypothetical protein